jgi:membrane fusion protein, multidrug efflux system
MKLKNSLYALLAILFIGFIAYRMTHNTTVKSGGKETKNTPMTVTGIVIESKTFENNLSVSGSIEPNEQVELHSEASGIVEKIYFQEGSTVTKGQVLFKVNDLELRAQLAQASTKEELAAENQRRAQLLLQKEAISQEEYDISRADHQSAQAQSQLIKAQIAKTAIRAPFSGKIGLRSISPGTYITPTVLVAKLVNSSTLKITFSIPEKYASQVKTNTVINFTVEGTTQKFTAKIYAIEPEVALTTRTLQIRAHTENSHGKLLPGTFAKVTLPLSTLYDAVVVPTEAIIPVQEGKIVYIANHGKAKKRSIETATRTDSQILVLSGLKAGDTLLTSGMMSLKDDAPIKVVLP